MCGRCYNLSRMKISSFCAFLVVFRKSWMDIEDQWEKLNDASPWVFICKEKKSKRKGQEDLMKELLEFSQKHAYIQENSFEAQVPCHQEEIL